MALLALVPAGVEAQPFAPEPFEPQQVQTRIIKMNGSFLGVGVQEVDADRAKALKLHEEAGVEITRVEEDSPASRAGLKIGDVIMQYNGQRIEGYEQFSRFVRETPPGREVKLAVIRNGAMQTIVAKIGAHKLPESAMVQIPKLQFDNPRFEMPNMPDMPRTFVMLRSSMLGIEGEALRGQLADYFGVKEGVLVRSVGKDTAAEKAGIKAGDVIVKVNDAKVASPSDISTALRALKGKATVPVLLQRDRHEMTVNATIEADKSGWDMAPPALSISGLGRVRI